MPMLHLRIRTADIWATDAREEDKQNGAEWAFAGSVASAAAGTIQISYR